MTTSDWVLVITTLFLGIIAIWQEQIKYLLGVRPNLTIKLKSSIGEYFPNNSPKIRYYHLIVSNSHKTAHALNARVAITAVSKPIADGTYREVPFVGPLQLFWRFQKIQSQFITIGANATCDLGYVNQETNTFIFTTLVPPKDFIGDLEAGNEIRIELKAIADNAISKPLYLHIAWNGKWSENENEMQKSLVIKEISTMGE